MHHHKLVTKKLGRKRDQRRALLKGLATSMVLTEKITTTKAKAKAVQPYVERLVTLAKAGKLHNRRHVLSKVTSKEAANKLFNDLAKRFAKREGGYTRVQLSGYRRGDNAELATLSFTEDAVKTAEKKATTNPVTKKTLTQEKADVKK